MKKILILFICVLAFLLVGCVDNGNTGENGENNNIENNNQGNKNNDGDKDKLVLEDNTPQWWIDLFTFDNVSIMLKNNLTIKKGDEYRCIDGKWYYKGQNEDSFVDHDGRYIFDLYLSRYSIFTYDEEGSCYKASGITLDESGYLREIEINVSNGNITNITDIATLNSSTIISTIDFYNYGVTTLLSDNNQEGEISEIIKKINCVKDEVGIYSTTITLGNGINDKGEIVMMFNGEKGGPQENNIIVTLRLDYEKDNNGKYQYKTYYNDEVYQNKNGLDEVKFVLEFGSTTRASKIVVTYTPEDGSTQEIYCYNVE